MKKLGEYTTFFLAFFEACFSDVTRDTSLKHARKNAEKKLCIHQIFLILFQFKKWMYNLYFILLLSIDESYFIYSEKVNIK